MMELSLGRKMGYPDTTRGCMRSIDRSVGVPGGSVWGGSPMGDKEMGRDGLKMETGGRVRTAEDVFFGIGEQKEGSMSIEDGRREADIGEWVGFLMGLVIHRMFFGG